MARLARQPHIPDEIPEPLASALRALTAEAPEQRPTAAQCAELLNSQPTAKLSAEPTLRVAQPRAHAGTRLYPAMVEPRRKRRWPWLAAVAGALAILAAILLFRPDSAPKAPTLPPSSGPPGVSRLPTDLTDLERMVGG